MTAIVVQCNYAELVNATLCIEKSSGGKRLSLELDDEEEDEEKESVRNLSLYLARDHVGVALRKKCTLQEIEGFSMHKTTSTEGMLR